MDIDDYTSIRARLQLFPMAHLVLEEQMGTTINVWSRPEKARNTQMGQGLCQLTGRSALKFLTQKARVLWAHRHIIA